MEELENKLLSAKDSLDGCYSRNRRSFFRGVMTGLILLLIALIVLILDLDIPMWQGSTIIATTLMVISIVIIGGSYHLYSFNNLRKRK